MAKRLGVIKAKGRRDKSRAWREGNGERHKVAVERSRKAKLKKANPMR